MTIDEFELSVSYAQFAIFDSMVERPFNEWSSRHIRQGFSWRPESACFHTPFDDGPHNFEIVLAVDRPAADERARRAIIVPFPVTMTRDLGFGSIGVAHTLHRNFDKNSMLVQFVFRSKAPLVRVHLYDEVKPLFAIVKADSHEMKNAVLEIVADPA